MDWEGEVGLGCLSVPLFGVLVGFLSSSINDALWGGEDVDVCQTHPTVSPKWAIQANKPHALMLAHSLGTANIYLEQLTGSSSCSKQMRTFL